MPRDIYKHEGGKNSLISDHTEQNLINILSLYTEHAFPSIIKGMRRYCLSKIRQVTTHIKKRTWPRYYRDRKLSGLKEDEARGKSNTHSCPTPTHPPISKTIILTLVLPPFPPIHPPLRQSSPHRLRPPRLPELPCKTQLDAPSNGKMGKALLFLPVHRCPQYCRSQWRMLS